MSESKTSRATPSATRAEAKLFQQTPPTPLVLAYAHYRQVLEASFIGLSTMAEVGIARERWCREASLEVDRHVQEPKAWEGLHAYNRHGYGFEEHPRAGTAEE